MPNLEGRTKTLLQLPFEPLVVFAILVWFLFTASTLHGKNTWPGGWSGPVRSEGDPPCYAQVCFSGMLFIIWLILYCVSLNILSSKKKHFVY